LSSKLWALKAKKGWARFLVPSVELPSTQLHVGLDKSHPQIRVEIQGKSCANNLRGEFGDEQFLFDYSNGWLSESWTSLLRLAPSAGRKPTVVC